MGDEHGAREMQADLFVGPWKAAYEGTVEGGETHVSRFEDGAAAALLVVRPACHEQADADVVQIVRPDMTVVPVDLDAAAAGVHQRAMG